MLSFVSYCCLTSVTHFQTTFWIRAFFFFFFFYRKKNECSIYRHLHFSSHYIWFYLWHIDNGFLSTFSCSTFNRTSSFDWANTRWETCEVSDQCWKTRSNWFLLRTALVLDIFVLVWWICSLRSTWNYGVFFLFFCCIFTLPDSYLRLLYYSLILIKQSSEERWQNIFFYLSMIKWTSLDMERKRRQFLPSIKQCHCKVLDDHLKRVLSLGINNHCGVLNEESTNCLSRFFLSELLE